MPRTNLARPARRSRQLTLHALYGLLQTEGLEPKLAYREQGQLKVLEPVTSLAAGAEQAVATFAPLAQLPEPFSSYYIATSHPLTKDPAVVPSLEPLEHAYGLFADKAYAAAVNAGLAQVIITTPKLAPLVTNETLLLVLVDQAVLASAFVAAVLDRTPQHSPGIHPTAVIGADAQIGENVYIGPYAVIEAGAHIGAGAYIDAHTYVGVDAQIGKGCHLHPYVYVGHDCVVGDASELLEAAVIGSDGFGYSLNMAKLQWQKVAQRGRVILGKRCAIGSGTTIDRGAVGDTVLGDDVTLDNQVHIGHNVRIGKGTIMPAGSTVAGSTTIGNFCVIAGCCAINGHIHLADRTTVSACTMVVKSVETPGTTISGGMPAQDNMSWRRTIVGIQAQALKKENQRVKALEEELKQLKSLVAELAQKVG